MPLIVCGVGAKCMAANAVSLAEWHMQLHTDYSLRVVVRPEDVAWSASPEPGVDRRRLERDGDEVARATSIVRYAPGSRFAAHTHGGGEEILVLEGVFSDEHGDYPAGTYLRNPIGTRHTPFSEPGTTLLVKLRQFDAADTTTLRLNTQSIPAQAGAAAAAKKFWCSKASFLTHSATTPPALGCGIQPVAYTPATPPKVACFTPKSATCRNPKPITVRKTWLEFCKVRPSGFDASP
jgi:quercetin dioxygenase-like cupin family protein